MALTITIEGYGVLANADSLTADTSTDGGTWNELGGGGVDLTGVSIQGGSAIAGAYSNKDGWQYYEMAGTALDFDTAGNEEGQHVYLWVQMPALAQLDTLANDGLRVRLGSSTTDYREWTFASNDDSNGWLGGWKCFVIDPTKAGTITDTGTFDLSAVSLYGFYLNTSSAGRGDNFFADRIVVGKGIRIIGTSTQGWQDVVDYCVASSTVLGMVQEREGIIYAMGSIWIGDAVSQAADVSFVDSGKIIKFAKCEYYSGSAWVSSMDVDNCGIFIEDHASYKTTFQDGTIVGTEQGRSGSTIIGNDNENVSIDLYGGNNSASVTLCYGTKFQSIYGTFNSGNNVNHKFLSSVFVDCSQFDPVGAPVIRNCIFAETKDVDSALLWNSSIDIEDCSFIANTLGAAIEMVETTNQDFDNLAFSGNTNDVLLNNGTPGTNIDISKTNGSDPTSYENAPSNTATITFVGAATTVTAKVTTEAGIDIENANTLIATTAIATNGLPFEQAVTSISSTGTLATVTFTAVHNLVSGDKLFFSGITDKTSDNNRVFTVTVTGTTTCTFVTTDTGSPDVYTGTIIGTFVLIKGLTNSSGEIALSRVYPVVQNIGGWARKSSADPYYKQGSMSGTISTTANVILSAVLVED